MPDAFIGGFAVARSRVPVTRHKDDPPFVVHKPRTDAQKAARRQRDARKRRESRIDRAIRWALHERFGPNWRAMWFKASACTRVDIADLLFESRQAWWALAPKS